MRIPSGVTDQVIYFVAVDSADFTTRETGLSTFTVYRSRNGAAAAAMTTPTVTEVDATNMPGVYKLLLDEDMTIGSGNDSEEMVFHITQASMAPVSRTIELYRPKITVGNTLDVTTTGAAGIDWGNIENKTTANDLSATDIQLVDTVTTYTGNTPQTADHTAAIADIPTVAEFNARTLAAASYFDPSADTVANVTTVATCTTNSDMVAAAPTANDIADQVWDESISTHTTPGTTGAVLADIETDATAILADTADLQANQGNWLTATGFSTHTALDVWHVAAASVVTASTIGLQLKTNIDAAVSSAGGDDAATIYAHFISGANEDVFKADVSALATQASVDVVDGNVDAILIDTNELQTNQGNWLTATGFATSAALATAQSDLDTITGTDGVTLATAQALYAPNKTVPDAAGTPVVLADSSSDAIIADAVWNALTATYGGVGSYGEHVESLSAGGDATEAKQDSIIAAVITNAAGADIAADIIAVKAETALIVADTNELQTDWVDGGRLDNLLDGAASAGDPWTTTLPGAYGAGTAGYIVGTNLDAVLSARTLASADYFDPASDAVANVTLVATTTTNTDMRGTDSANTVVPDAAGTAATLHGTTDGLITTVDTVVDSILVDTNELQLLWTPGGILDTLLYAIEENLELHNTMMSDDVTTIRNDIFNIAGDMPSKAQVQVLYDDWLDGGRLDLLLDATLAMLDDARAEPGQGAPAVNPDAMTKIDYLYKAWRNSKTQTATTFSLYNDAGTIVDQKATVSDDGATATVGEIVTGP